MKININILYPVVMVILGCQLFLMAEAKAESLNESKVISNTKSQAMKMPMYKPPRRGAPTLTIGGGTRGINENAPSVSVLAPDHIALTMNEQPVLSWYTSNPDSMRLEFLLIDEEGIDPLLELNLKSSNIKEGIQSLNLARHGVKLKPGVKYQWSITLIVDENHRSNDIISTGMIEKQDMDEALAAKLTKADSTEDVYIFAEEGYWYDAISLLTELIEKNPENQVFKQLRTELLNQIGLIASASN